MPDFWGFDVGEIAGILFVCFGANIDVLLAAASQSELFSKHSRFFKISCVALFSTVFTSASTVFGKLLAGYIPPNGARCCAGALFCLLSLYTIGSELRTKQNCGKPQKHITPRSKTGRLLLLSLSLAVNNVGLGVAAGVGGLSPAAVTVFTLLFAFLAAYVGVLCAGYLEKRFTKRKTVLFSNLLLLLLGGCELAFGIFGAL